MSKVSDLQKIKELAEGLLAKEDTSLLEARQQEVVKWQGTIEDLKRKLQQIRDYTYRTPPKLLLDEAETMLSSEEDEAVKIAFCKAIARVVREYLKL